MMKKLSALLLALMFLTFANSASAGDWFKIVKTLSTGEKVELAIGALKLTAEGIKAFCADAANPKQCETDAVTVLAGVAGATTVGVLATGTTTVAGAAGTLATLTTVGASVGGGAVAGAVVVVAAPVVIVGGLLYWMVSD